MADWAEDVCLQSDCWLIDWVGEEGEKGAGGKGELVQLEKKWEGKQEDGKKVDRAWEKQEK